MQLERDEKEEKCENAFKLILEKTYKKIQTSKRYQKCKLWLKTMNLENHVGELRSVYQRQPIYLKRVAEGASYVKLPTKISQKQVLDTKKVFVDYLVVFWLTYNLLEVLQIQKASIEIVFKTSDNQNWSFWRITR